MPLRLGRPSLGLSKKARADLDRETLQPRQVGGFHIYLAVVLGHIQAQDRWHRHLGRGKQGKGLLDSIDRVAVEGDAATQVGFAEQGDGRHSNTSSEGNVSFRRRRR